jgi:hypothetical protein
MTPDQIIREEFERWQLGDGKFPRVITRSPTNLDGYLLAQTQGDWITWQACWAIATGYSE